ncbi:N(4)-(Beta-N-acetylglucosaminyl)-L-asparaginase-like [Pecten maximus]|uniref:N(4)-(Beta-N-acetylglucosaminyl)-L-asparaginase- like n=1 Tax=Pecten maximus TaxID=6579 RepID=UPI0014583D18|nr:N(4)-(Beta-N-acetylglucosaminyl)-L-asparaginase-like [Pecten maximus]XP_033749529.1 N(4)-(Beta-N-acetylglucosaminyl)-L-asparaginase-like [Pecten maximus]
MPFLVVGTWTFSREAVATTAHCLQQNLSCTDAVERGINQIEVDEAYGPCVVGVGGFRNSDGYLELDAAMMEGRGLRTQFGAVTALQGVPRAVSVARAVMEKCSHNMLTGSGATKFAKEQGFAVEDNLLTAKSNQTKQSIPGHDTLGILAVDGQNHVCSGVSTSGSGNKHPGRVGDSALPGNGLYADGEAGAACCSGDGDQILMYCPSFRVVLLMKEGKQPQAACEEVINDIRRKCDGQIFEVAIIAVNMKSEYGAASTLDTWTDPLTGQQFAGFPYVVYTDVMSEPEIKLSKTNRKDS